MTGSAPFPIFPDNQGLKQRQSAISQTRKAFPGAFRSQASARHFLKQIILPPSRRWAFISTGKNASSSTLRFLFQAEFGVPLSAHFVSPNDINPDAVVHQLADSDVFARAINLGLSADVIKGDKDLLRLCVVRNPYARALSAYSYFCRSDAEAKQWFLADRLRINAVTGFDWQEMPGTPEGFRRFLRYIEAEVARVGADGVDGHWRPQTAFIKPEVFRPGIVGRMEALDGFFAKLAHRLEVPASVLRNIAHTNRQGEKPLDYTDDRTARQLIERIYAQDFEAFGY